MKNARRTEVNQHKLRDINETTLTCNYEASKYNEKRNRAILYDSDVSRCNVTSTNLAQKFCFKIYKPTAVLLNKLQPMNERICTKTTGKIKFERYMTQLILNQCESFQNREKFAIYQFGLSPNQRLAKRMQRAAFCILSIYESRKTVFVLCFLCI